ncbi:MAG: RNA-binding protein [Myxococcota bacterium]
MSRADYGFGKRQRENEKARKRKEKARRRAEKRSRGPSESEYVSAEAMTGELPTIDQAMAALQKRQSGDRGARSIPSKLFVGSLSRRTTVESLRAAFEEFGPVLDAVVITNRETGESRGFGFVTMESRRDGQKAMEALNDAELDGRTIVVNPATER